MKASACLMCGSCVTCDLCIKVLAGEDVTVTEVKQQDCRFQLDIRQVSASDV